MSKEKDKPEPVVSIESLCGCAWEAQTPAITADAVETTVDVWCVKHSRYGLRVRIRLPGAVNPDLLRIDTEQGGYIEGVPAGGEVARGKSAEKIWFELDRVDLPLFFAAPELLEACRLVLSEHSTKPFHEARDNADRALEGCRAAIAKAEGAR